MSALLWLLVAIVVLFGFVVFRHGAPYVPSRRRDLKIAFERLYPLGKKDLLVDIGAGDGVVLRTAVGYGARAIGYELNPLLVWIGRWLNRHHTGTQMILADFYHISLPPDTTVVYFFADARDIGRMAELIQRQVDQQSRSLMVISLAFQIPGHRAERHVEPYFLYRFTPLHPPSA